MPTVTLRPVADGEVTTLIAVGAAQRWDCVDEDPANDDTDRVTEPSGNLGNAIGVYKFDIGALNGSFRVNSVTVHYRSSNPGSNGAGNRIRAIMRDEVSNTNSEGATESPTASSSYADFSHQFSSGLPSTLQDLEDDFSFGIEHFVFSGNLGTGDQMRTTQVYIVVDYSDVVLEQEGFRFRDDDGDEDAATWLENQDTNLTREAGVNTRIRMLINATNDPPSQQYQLEYKKSTDGEYRKVLPFGGRRISALGSAVEHDTAQGQFNKAVRIDSTHWLLLYQTTGADGFAQVFTIDGSGNVSEVGTGLEFDTTNLIDVEAILFDGSNHVLVTWSGSGNDGFAQILTVNLSTWAVTAEGSALEFDTTNGNHFGLVQIDSTHALVTYQGASGDGFAQVLAVNTSTWAVTEPAAALEFDTSDYSFGWVAKVNNDDTRYIVFHQGVDGDGFVRILTVNTSTWAVTATSVLEFDTSNGTHNRGIQLDATHFLNLWGGGAGATGKVQVFSVNTGTWAVSAVGTALDFDASTPLWHGISLLDEDADAYYVAISYSGNSSVGYIELLRVDKTTWAVTELTDAFQFDTLGNYNTLTKVSATRVINFWAGVGADGFARAFDILPEPITLSPSSNITAGGENTTAQLTAPSGKTTSDFDAGRIQDDENPGDAVDITADDYTELEWCLIATDEAAVDDIYQFRVTIA